MSVTHSVLDDVPGSLHGACTRAQLVAARGLAGLRAALASGTVVPLWPRVLVAAGRRFDPRTLAAAALLVGGERAVLDGLTAARLHGVTSEPLSGVEVVAPYDRWIRPRPGLRVRSGRVAPRDVVLVDGLRVLAADAALAELLCTAPTDVALACAGEACRRDDGMRELVAARIAARADRRGTSRAAALVAMIDPGTSRLATPSPSARCRGTAACAGR